MNVIVIAALKRAVSLLHLALQAAAVVVAVHIFQPQCHAHYCSVMLPDRNGSEIVAYWERWEVGVYLQRYSPPTPEPKIGIISDPRRINI